MLITKIEDGTLFASATLNSIRHGVAHDVARVLSQSKVDGGYGIKYQKTDGSMFRTRCRVFNDIIVVDTEMRDDPAQD